MNLLRNFSFALRRASSASQSLDRLAANADPLARLPSLTSLTSTAALDASSSPGTAPPAGDSSRPTAVLKFPAPAGAQPLHEVPQTPPIVYSQQGDQAAILKAGQQQASWSNPFVSHALPAVLQLQRHLGDAPLNQGAVRTQLGLEVRLYRERLAGSGCEWDQVRDASYLLCTYLDENVSEAARHHTQVLYDGERSLLVEFHDDAWGGEDAFSDLARWMKAEPPPLALLAFYELILSLGWQGRYRVLDRGDVLLQDLRSQLHALIWHNLPPEPLGTALIAPALRRRGWWTPSKAATAALTVAVLTYALVSLSLDAQGRPVRNALAAWTPPTRTINLAETLPQPLPKLLAERWLTAYKHPQGWLLVFRSDGAFNLGKANVRQEFQHNIERLGLALAPWPGDLEVIGHTDQVPIGGNQFSSNQALSEARARMVADELRKTAVRGGPQAPPNAMQRNIEYSGRGDAEPIDPAKTKAAFERNRRVDVFWKVKKEDVTRRGGAVPTAGTAAAVEPPLTDGVEVVPDGPLPYTSDASDVAAALNGDPS